MCDVCGCGDATLVPVEVHARLLEHNDHGAAHNREHFRQHELSSALNEIASVARIRITVEEALIPVSEVVRGACELLGLDPLYVANEGRLVVFVPERDAGRALEILRSQTVSAGTVRAGTVYESASGIVTLRSRVGGNRVLDMLSGEQLPRIC